MNTTHNNQADIEVTDLGHMTCLLNAWHADKVSILTHLRDIPEGTEMRIGEDDPITLTGDAHTAFRLGIELSLNELGNLPYTTEAQDYLETLVHSTPTVQ